MSSHDNDPERARRAYLDAQREIEHDERQKNIYKKAIQEANQERMRNRLLIFLGIIAAIFLCICVCGVVLYGSMPKTQTPHPPANNFFYYGSPTPKR